MSFLLTEASLRLAFHRREVVRVFSAGRAFAALDVHGAVSCWGDPNGGGEPGEARRGGGGRVSGE